MDAHENQKFFAVPATAAAKAATADREGFKIAHVNFVYSFWIRWRTGLEYMWGRVDSFGASHGTINAGFLHLLFLF